MSCRVVLGFCAKVCITNSIFHWEKDLLDKSVAISALWRLPGKLPEAASFSARASCDLSIFG
jgi:hypothetical protein